MCFKSIFDINGLSVVGFVNLYHHDKAAHPTLGECAAFMGNLVFRQKIIFRVSCLTGDYRLFRFVDNVRAKPFFGNFAGGAVVDHFVESFLDFIAELSVAFFHGDTVLFGRQAFR